MSAVPGLDAATLVGPYKAIAPPPTFNFPTPVSNADLYRQRKNEQIDAKRRAGTQALQTIKGNVPIGGFPIPATGAAKPSIALGKAPPPAAAAPQAATPDAYLQSQQNLIGAENKLLGLMGQAQPQYKPPNKGLEYLAAGISLLFPGAPIAHAAGGLLQGMQAGADQRYQRDQQAQQQEIGNAERQTQVFGTIADAQARIAAQNAATQERALEFAQRHSDAMSALQEKRSEFQQMLPIHSATAQSLINYRIGELSNAAARNTITQQDAQLRAQTVVQIAAFREASMNGRHAGDLGMRSAANQLGLLEKQTDQQIRALDASVAADPTQAATAQASAAQLIANEQNQAQKIIGNVSSGKPDVLKIENFAVQLPIPAAQPQYGYDPNTGYQPPGPGQIPATPVWGTPTQQTVIPTQAQVQTDQHPPASAPQFSGHPGLGAGKGIADTAFSGALHHYAQASFPSVDALLHDIATSPGSKDLSSAQIQQIVQAWQSAHPAATGEHPAQAAPTATPAAHPGGLSDVDRQVLDLRTKAWIAQGYTPTVAHAKALAEVRASNMPEIPKIPKHTQDLHDRINITMRAMKGQSEDKIISALERLGVNHVEAARLAKTPGEAAHPTAVAGGSHDARPFDRVGFVDSVTRQDIATTDPRLQSGLSYVLGQFSPEVTSVRHGIHHPGSAHYEGKAVDIGAFDGTQVGPNDVTWRAVMTAIKSRYFSWIGTIPEIALNPEALAFAHANGVTLKVDVGMDPAHPNRHVHFEVP